MGRGKKWVMLVAGNAGKLRSEVQNAETDLERIISGYIIRNPASGECQDGLHLDSARGSFINSVQLHMRVLSDGFIDEIRVKRRAGDNSCGTSGKWLALCNANTLTENIVGSLRWFTPAPPRPMLTCEDEGDARGEHENLPLPGAEAAAAEHQGHRHHGARHEEEPRGLDHGV